MKGFSYLRNNSNWQDGFSANCAGDYLRRLRIASTAPAPQLQSDVNFLLTSADVHTQMTVRCLCSSHTNSVGSPVLGWRMPALPPTHSPGHGTHSLPRVWGY